MVSVKDLKDDLNLTEEGPVLLMNKYLIEKELGRGAFGCVYKASYVADKNVKVAVKKIKFKKNRGSTVQFLKDVKNEISILKKIDSPYIIKLYEYHVTPENIYIVSEYCDGNELLQIIMRDSFLPEDVARYYFRQLVYGMMHCHHLDIMHRDIKAENVMFKESENLNIKIIDFGLGTKGIELAQGVVGTPYYMAPEIFVSKYYDKRYDIWSLGVLLYVMLTGTPPFPGKDHKKIVTAILKGDVNYDHDNFKNCSKDCVELMKLILVKYPNDRISLEDILKHPWMLTNATAKIKISHKKAIVTELQAFQKMNIFTKAVKHCMSKIYESSSLSELKKQFLRFDDNHDGILNYEEFRKVMEVLKFDKVETEMMINCIDLDHNGTIEYSEFISSCYSLEKTNMLVASELMFNIMDKDSSGSVEFVEFKNFFVNQNIKYDVSDLENIFNELDENGDGKVDLKEFEKNFKHQFE